MEFLYYFFYLFSFILGAVMGSFLNVVSIDIEEHVINKAKFNWKKVFSKRSSCPNCGYTLRAHNLVPLLSFLIQKCRCSNCKEKISWRYFWVEFFSGLVFLSIFYKLAEGFNYLGLGIALNTAYMYLLFSLLTVIFLFDMRHKIIPNVIVYPFILLSFIYGFIDFTSLSLQVPSLLYVFSGIILAAPFYFLWLISSGKWIGFADSKLALGIGWLVVATTGTLSSAFSSVALSFWIGALVGLSLVFLSKLQKSGLIFKDKNFTIKSEIPFGPFLIIGLWVIFYFGFNFFKLDPGLFY